MALCSVHAEAIDERRHLGIASAGDGGSLVVAGGEYVASGLFTIQHRLVRSFTGAITVENRFAESDTLLDG
jgi:hypothetical protein